MTKQPYNFDAPVVRTGTVSYKWDQSEKLFGRPDILPLWVADMDFEPPREVVDAIVKRAEQGIYGYTFRPASYYEAVAGWQLRRHGWKVEHEWISSSPGVVPALALAVLACTKPGDGVILQSPVYYPFYDVVRMNDRVVVDNPLILENGRYVMDYDLLERQAAEGAKLLLLCSPHNPGGRVWTRDELERVAAICERHGVTVVADEIHEDLVFGGHKHTPFASLSAAAAQRTITCVAPSKTFNLAGLQAASVIIPDDGLRRKYNHHLKALSLHMESHFGLTAVVAGYTCGGEWLDQLLPYLEANRDALVRYVQANIPEIEVMVPEGTYMVWMDCRRISEDPAVLKTLMFERAGVAFSEGSVFGRQGAGYLRVNLACPRALLEEALARFGGAVAEWRSGR